MLNAVRREALDLIKEGRATPGGIEDEMRSVLADVGKRRRAARYVSEGDRPASTAEREGYVVGTTVNLIVRMRR